MNPIGLMCAVVVVGLPVAAWVRYGLRVAMETALAIHPPEVVPGPEPVNEDDVDPLLEWITGLPAVRSEDDVPVSDSETTEVPA